MNNSFGCGDHSITARKMNRASVLLFALLALAAADEITPNCQTLKLTGDDKKNLFESAGSKLIYDLVNKVTKQSASEFCTSKGLTLASPKTLADIEDISKVLIERGNRGNFFWLSATDAGHSPGQFHWVDGTTLNRTTWEGGQPDDYSAGKETCVYLNPAYSKLRDLNCDISFFPLCEVPASLKSCATA